MTHLQSLLEKARAVRMAGTGQAGVPSPCVSVCKMDAANRQCDGCLRTLDEIAAWSTMTDEDRRHVWRLIEQRGGVSL